VFNKEKLLKMLSGVEIESCEFKKAKSSYSTTKCLEYCTAIANFGGGYLIFGVEDKTKEVVGSNAFENTNDIKKKILEKIRIIVKSYEYFLDSKRVLVLEIPPHSAGRFIDLDGQYFLRNGESLVKMSWDQLREEAFKIIPDYSAEIIAGTSVDDLDKMIFLNLMTNIKDNTWKEGKASFKEYLQSRRLLTDKGLTIAALSMFGKSDSIKKFLPQAETIIEYRNNPDSIDYDNRKSFCYGFLGYINIINDNISNYAGHISYNIGLFRDKIDVFNKDVIREALLNAFCHRDYSNGNPITIYISRDKLHIKNPGGFFEGIDEENIIFEQSHRNKLIAESLERWKLVERSGQGYKRMWEKSILEAKNGPDVSNTTDHIFSLILDGTIIDRNILKYIDDKYGQLDKLSIRELLTIHKIALNQKIKASPKELNILLGKGLIEKDGRGRGTRYSLPKEYYNLSNKRGVYTRRKGLSDNMYKSMIIKHIETHGFGKIQDFEDVLPNLPRTKIHFLLSALKKTGKITFEGSRKTGMWIMCE